MGSPLVSVIMPVYNAAAFVSQAIGSVLAQTLSEWELLVVDDGSTDDTARILCQFDDPRITVVHQENQGSGAARNAGLDRAGGTFISFLDADDVYLPEALESYVGFLRTHPEFDVVFADGHICDVNLNPLMRFSEYRARVQTGVIVEALILSNVVSFPVCTTVRRSAIDECQARFDPELRLGQDWHFWIFLSPFVRFGYLPKLTCLYRSHEGNITHSYDRERRRDQLVLGRAKVMDATWFGGLSLGTRETFFYNLLVGLLAGRQAQQEAFCLSPAFLDLPARSRARLLRLVATDYLLRGDQPGAAGSFLRQSLAAWDRDRRASMLLATVERAPSLAGAMVRAWSSARRAGAALRPGGRKRRARVPTELLP